MSAEGDAADRGSAHADTVCRYSDPGSGHHTSGLGTTATTPGAATVVTPPVSTPDPVPPAQGVAATAGKRVALVVGNGNYATMPRLANPRNDAQDLAASLKTVGFDVSTGLDLGRIEMEETFIRFVREARHADTALVFFAGHAIQHNGVNYLMPVDARITDESISPAAQPAGHSRRLAEWKPRPDRHSRCLPRQRRDPAACPDIAGAPVRGADARAEQDGSNGERHVRGVRRPGQSRGGGRQRAQQPVYERAAQASRHRGDRASHGHDAELRKDVVDASGSTQWPEVSDSLVGEFVFKGSP